MPRDHYVAETYLKHFVGNDGLLHVYQKHDGKYFPSRPRDICHEWNGDLIEEFLSTPDLLGRYRKIFEPIWNPALAELQAGRASPGEKMAIAGYWANLLVCTPAWRRIGLECHDHQAMHFLRASDSLKTENGHPDEKLKDILAKLDQGQFRFETKPDFLRAINARNLWKYAWDIYNFDWIVIKNETGIEFLTSDNPVAFDDPGPLRSDDPLRLPRYLPITPGLCLHCHMSLIARPHGEPDFSLPPKGMIRTATIRPSGVRAINRAVVQCAEDLVISRTKGNSVEALTAKYANYRIDTDFIAKRRPDAFLAAMRIRVREQPSK